MVLFVCDLWLQLQLPPLCCFLKKLTVELVFKTKQNKQPSSFLSKDNVMIKKKNQRQSLTEINVVEASHLPGLAQEARLS